MKTGLIVAAFAALFPTGAFAQTPAPPLAVGQVLGNEKGQVINGWRQMGGGLYPGRVTRNFVTYEENTCCYVTFSRPGFVAVSRTEAIARKPTGGVEAERILATKVIPTNGLEDIDCNIMWIRPVVSLYNPKTKVVKSVVISGDEFQEFTWIDDGSWCDLGD